MTSLRCRIITIDTEGQRHDSPWAKSLVIAKIAALCLARRDHIAIARMYCVADWIGPGPITCGTPELRHPSPPQV